MLIPLDKIDCCQSATIYSINNGLNIKTRLMDMGVCEGTKITKVFESPLRNPCAYKVRNTVIAIRNNDASKIMVKQYAR